MKVAPLNLVYTHTLTQTLQRQLLKQAEVIDYQHSLRPYCYWFCLQQFVCAYCAAAAVMMIIK